MSEDYMKGFMDGFKLGLEEGKKLADKIDLGDYLKTPVYPGPYVPPTAPTWYQTYPNIGIAYSTGPTGSLKSDDIPKGMNGPSGPISEK